MLIASAAGLASELWPIPGALLAALIFKEGIHSSEPAIYIELTFVFNFLFFAGLTFGLLAIFSKNANADGPWPTGPREGRIYTESELDEFKKRSQNSS
jgi:hypothetical protein